MAHLAINGGAKACAVGWPRWPIWGDEERTALNGVLESGEWWYGEKVAEFEAAFARLPLPRSAGDGGRNSDRNSRECQMVTRDKWA